MKNVIANIGDIYRNLNPSLFLPAHVIISLYLYFRSRGGRYRLSQEIMISDSRSRVIYQILQHNNIVIASRGRKGAKLTTTGKILCNKLFTNLIFLDFDRSWNLGILSVGEVNALIAFPLSSEIGNKITSLDFRDTAMRSGALGATIFKGKMKKETFNLEFYDTTSNSQILDKSFTKALNDLGQEISEYLSPKPFQKEWLIIAGTSSSSKQDIKFPFVHENNYSPFKIARLAAVQCAWYIIANL